MTNKEIQEKVINIFSTFFNIDRAVIVPEAILAHIVRDSIQLFEVVIEFEREFGLQVKYDDLIKIITVQDVYDYITSQLKEAKSE